MSSHDAGRAERILCLSSLSGSGDMVSNLASGAGRPLVATVLIQVLG